MTARWASARRRSRTAFSTILSTAAAALLVSATITAGPITVTILHTNDMHSHAEPSVVNGVSLGGYARQATLIKRFRASDPNPILLCGGDTFQGTVYFSVYEGMSDAAFMTYAGYQAMAAGNHEFDRGVAALANFGHNVDFPILAANLDLSREKALADLIKPSAELVVGGETIGLVGAITPMLPTFTLLPDTVTMKKLVPSVQEAVDNLRQRGINKIVVLSHCGYLEDLDLAARLSGVDVIVGGHSHTLLGASEIAHVRPAGPYPTVVKGADGATILVVQAWDWGKVLGRIKVSFDDQGKVASWADAAPIPVDASVPPDPVERTMLAAFARPVEGLQTRVIGRTDTGIGEPRSSLRTGENTMANVIADAMLASTKNGGSVAALMNSGGVRAALSAGPVTYGQAVTVEPFANTLIQLDLTGDELRRTVEHGVALAGGGLVHPSHGLAYAVDYARPAGSRITSLTLNGAAIDPAATYRVTLNSFMAAGGDGHAVLKAAAGKRYDTGIVDIEALVDYFKNNDPLNPKLEGRITVYNLSAAPRGH